MIQIAKMTQYANGGLHSVISFNYDDILEACLARSNPTNYAAIFGSGRKQDHRLLPIVHVHGLLPREGDITAENAIVLAEDVYHEQYTSAYSWQNWSQLQRYVENTCLFVGLSFSDPNLRRLLDLARTLRRGLDPVHIRISRLSRRSTEGNIRYLEDGMKPLTDLYSQSDAESLGVETLWVEEYDEIASILSEVSSRI